MNDCHGLNMRSRIPLYQTLEMGTNWPQTSGPLRVCDNVGRVAYACELAMPLGSTNAAGERPYFWLTAVFS